MEKLIIQIEASKDYFDGYAINVKGVYGAGKTVAACKANINDGIKLLVETSSEHGYALPEWLIAGNYEIEYIYDIQSMLSYYQGILTKSALERISGINQKQLHHYAAGIRRPRPETVRKIETAIHSLSDELKSIRLS